MPKKIIVFLLLFLFFQASALVMGHADQHKDCLDKVELPYVPTYPKGLGKVKHITQKQAENNILRGGVDEVGEIGVNEN